METERKSLIVAESSRFVAQVSNAIVLRLNARVREIEALARTISTAVVALPKTDAQLRDLVPQLMDFQGDAAIAGGGVWPEPYAFDPQRERCSLFWDRADRGELTFFDSYNQSSAGYHREPWYVVARHLPPGQCCWSASYVDSYSLRPMVTCTAPLWQDEQFLGAVTIDLRLDQLSALVTSWQQITGGYIFVVDRNNRFITFPDMERVIRWDATCPKVTLEFLRAGDLAATEPAFEPIATALEQVNRELIAAAAGKQTAAIAKAIGNDSPEIAPAEAKLIAAAIANVLPVDENQVWLYDKLEIDTDLLLNEACTVFVLNVPSAYWKVVVVKPFSEAAMATYSLVQAEKMSSLSRLVGGVAHEINNPISFIYGNLRFARDYSENLLELARLYQKHYPQPPEAIQHCLEHLELDFVENDLQAVFQSMQSGAERIRQIVQALRNFARMDEAERKKVDLHEGLENALLLLASPLQAPGRPIRVRRQFSDLPPVECYASLLNQAFMNILLNAIEALATYDCSEPEICLQTWQPSPNRVAIAIRDNGPGMTEAVRSQIFNPFFSTKAVGGGTGLGLAISYQIVVARHHGDLTCTSTPGVGSEFRIELPVELH